MEFVKKKVNIDVVLTPLGPTPQKDYTHSNKSSAKADRFPKCV